MEQRVIGKAPSHLVKHRHTFYFRYSVPKDIKPVLNRTEIRLSLKTSYLTDARAKARRLSVIVDGYVREIRKGKSGLMSELTDQKIREIVQQNLSAALEDAEEGRINRSVPLTENGIKDQEFNFFYLKTEARQQLASSDYRTVSNHAASLLQEWGIDVDEKSTQFRKLCRELLKGTIRFCEIEEQRTVGDYSDEAFTAEGNSQEATNDKKEHGSKTPLLSEAVDLYVQENRELGSWNEKTLKSNIPMLKQFVELVGDIPVHELNIEHVRQYKTNLMKLPANMKKMSAYREKSIAELLKMDIPKEERMSNTTLSNRFNKTSSFIIWTKRNGYIEDDTIKDILVLKSTKQANQYRDVFSKEDLERIFHSRDYLEGKFKQPSKFWVPLLGLLTGARLEEICQLHVDDIVQEDGVWCLDINDNGRKSLKTPSSKRFVPLHDTLVRDLGFLQYVERLKEEDETLLFPELEPKASGRFSDNLSKWFGRYRRKVQVQEGRDGKKDFHSFRHTLSHWCDNHKVPEKRAASLLGHAHESITYGRYSKNTAPRLLYEEIVSKLEYGIDLSCLKSDF